MVGENPNPVSDDLASAPVSDAPLSPQQGDEAIAALLGDLSDEPDPAERTEGDESEQETPPSEDDEDEVDPASLEEDAENPDDTEEKDAPDYADGQFVPDGGKVKMPDGRTISVAELKEFADTRAKEMQRHFTQQNMEFAEKTKAKEAEWSELSEQVAREREYARWTIEQLAPQEPHRPELSAAQDPMAWLQYQEDMGKYNAVVTAWQAMHQGKEAETQRQQAEQKQQLDAYVAKEREALFNAIPSLKDEAKRKVWFETTWADASKYYGVTPEELNGITDHRQLMIIRDAIATRRAREKAPTVQKEVQAKPSMVQGSGKRQNPSAVAQRNSQATVQRLRETGSVRDADAALLKFLK